MSLLFVLASPVVASRHHITSLQGGETVFLDGGGIKPKRGRNTTPTRLCPPPLLPRLLLPHFLLSSSSPRTSSSSPPTSSSPPSLPPSPPHSHTFSPLSYLLSTL